MKLKVFNPYTGLHEDVSTLKEAIELRTNIITSYTENLLLCGDGFENLTKEQIQEYQTNYINEWLPLCSIVKIEINENGDETWVNLNANEL